MWGGENKEIITKRRVTQESKMDEPWTDFINGPWQRGKHSSTRLSVSNGNISQYGMLIEHLERRTINKDQFHVCVHYVKEIN